MRWLLLLAVVLGCDEVVYEGLPGMRTPGDQAGYREGRDEAIAAARIAAKVACDRLWSDCSSLCDDLFVYCGNSEEQCVEDYALGAVEDLRFPVYSRDLAEACAEQFGERSCVDLDPSSAECDSAVLEGCPNDEDGYGRPYSWLAAYGIDQLPATIRPHLCEAADEWFAFQLEAGESVAVTLVSGTGSAWLDVNTLVGVAGDRQDVESIGHSIHLDATSTSQDTELFDPVPVAGIYYLSVSLNRSVTGDMEIAIGTDRRMPPSAEQVAVETETLVYGALCERLHGDCASACSEADFYCGDSVEACKEAYARSAVEEIFDGDPRVLDRAQASACAAELSGRACGELGNASATCGELLVSHCASDPEAYARPWAGRMAKSVSLPATLDLDLCDGVGQFFRIDLNAGDRLAMRTGAPPFDSAYGQLYPPSATDEDLERGTNYLFYSFYLSENETVSDPVPFTGSYYFHAELNATGPLSISLRRM